MNLLGPRTMRHTVGFFLVVFIALFGWCCIPMPVNGMEPSDNQPYECCVPQESSTQPMPDHAVCLVSHDGHLMSTVKLASVSPPALAADLMVYQVQLFFSPAGAIPPVQKLTPHSFLITHCHFLS